ncbi:MAG TPA: hypothetical protein VJ302_33745 [Blastocatellia bacterium]|nr:hypothetical protein [Blastocatellia bacterium]
MLLFIGFCAIILMLGISEAFGKSESEKSDGLTNNPINPESNGLQ